MSHFTTLKTQIVSKDHLIKALADLRSELGLGEVRQDTAIRGYQGNTTRAEVVVGTRNSSYDIGFRKEGDTFDLVADWWGIKDIKQETLGQRLQQRYAYHVVKEQLDQKHFSLVEEQVDADQTIRLVVRRVV